MLSRTTATLARRRTAAPARRALARGYGGHGMPPSHWGAAGGMGAAANNYGLYDRATTILAVRRGDEVVLIGDGQVSKGSGVVKPNARKIRRIGANNEVLVGFAGSTADALALLEKLEEHINDYPGQLVRAAVATAKLWRTDKVLRNLEAVLVAVDKDVSLYIGGNGDVLEPHDDVIGVGSGGDYAMAAARALIDVPDMTAEDIARKSMKIAADVCVYTNHNFVMDKITGAKSKAAEAAEAAAADGPAK